MRLGEQVLHRLEGPDGDAVLPALLRVGQRDVEDAAHETDHVSAGERQTQRRPCVEILVREQTGLVGQADDGRTGFDRAHRAREVRALALTGGLDQCNAMAAAIGEEDIRCDAICCGSVDGDDLSAHGRGRLDCGEDQVGGEGDHCPVGRSCAGAPREIGREERADEGDVGDRLAEGFGDDRRFDPAGEWRACVVVVAQLQPAGVDHRLGQPFAALRVVEVGHRARPELVGQLSSGAPQLGLFGSVARVHG